jgi:hypothetical protein
MTAYTAPLERSDRTRIAGCGVNVRDMPRLVAVSRSYRVVDDRRAARVGRTAWELSPAPAETCIRDCVPRPTPDGVYTGMERSYTSRSGQ